MSIRSMIFVEVLPEDLGKELKPNKSLIYNKGLRFENIDDDSRISDKEIDKFPAVLLDKKYIGIYHHWDGHPLDVGSALIKCFNTYKEALVKSVEMDEGFIRDKDGKYYTGNAIVYGDHTREPKKSIYRNSNQGGDEYENAITTFIRQNSGRNRR